MKPLEDESFFRWVGSSSRQGEARFHCRFLQTDTPEAASKNPPTACWNDFSALAICDKENNIRKSIFSGCLKTGASVTSALDDVTWPMSEWNINSFKIDLLYQPNTVLYQRGRSALHLSAQKETHTHTHTPICLQYYMPGDAMIDPISQQNTHFHTRPSMHTHRLMTVCG